MCFLKKDICKWQCMGLVPICSSPCWCGKWLDTGQKVGTSFTAGTAFAKHHNLSLSPLSKPSFLNVIITKTDNICCYLHCILGKKIIFLLVTHLSNYITVKRNTVIKLSPVTSPLESCSFCDVELCALTRDVSAPHEGGCHVKLLQAWQCFCKMFIHSFPSLHLITSKGAF